MFSVGLVAEKRKSVYSQCCMMMTAARVTDAPHGERERESSACREHSQSQVCAGEAIRQQQHSVITCTDEILSLLHRLNWNLHPLYLYSSTLK